MNKELELLDNFVTKIAAQGTITMKEYLELKSAIDVLDSNHFGTCVKCKISDVFINENGKCNWCYCYDRKLGE